MKKKLVFIFKFFKILTKRERFFLIGGTILAVFLLILSIQTIVQKLLKTEPAVGGVWTEGLYEPVDTLNPFLANNSTEKSLINLIFGSLVRPNGQGGYELELAKKILILDNGLTYQIELHHDLKWSNGEKITSADVVYSFNLDQNYGSAELKNILKGATIKPLDRSTLIITLPVKNNYFIQNLSFLKIVPMKIWSGVAVTNWLQDEKNLTRVSSGPYVLTNRTKIRANVEKLTFETNKNYFNQPMIPRLEFYSYPDIQQAFDALKIREIKALAGVPPDLIPALLNNRSKIEKIFLPRVIGVFFNQTAINTTNLNFNSISSQINREEIKNKTFDGYADIADNIFSRSFEKLYHLTQVSTNSSSSSNSNQNLAPESTSSSSTIELIVPRNYFFQKIGDYLKNKFGWKINVQSVDKIQLETIPNKNYQALLFGINYNLYPELTPFFNPISPYDLTNSDNPKIQKVIQNLEIAPLNQSDYSQNLSKIEELIKQNEPSIFLTNPDYLYLVPKNLGGYNAFYLNQPEERFDKIEEWHLETRIKW